MTGLTETVLATLADPLLLLAALATAVAGIMRGYAGFGTAILLSPLFATLFGPREGVPINLLMELVVSAQLLPKAFHEADRRVVFPLGLAACITTPIGAYVLIHADGEILRRTIGALVLTFGLALMSPWRYHGARPLPLNLGIGALAGLLKGSTGMSGPPVILYLLSGPEEAKRHRANLILFFGLIGVVSVIPPLWAGLIGVPTLVRTIILLPIMVICVRIGASLFHVVPVVWYRRFAFTALVITGLIALLA